MVEGQKSKVAGVADFVICLDITGSMSPCIDNLKKSLRGFIESLTAPIDVEKQNAIFKITDWKGRLLPYRDLEEDPPGEEIFEDFPFVDDADQLKSQLDDPRVVANHGGGFEESSLDALYRAVVNSEWPVQRKSNKFVLLFSDAPTRSELSTKTVATGPRDVNEVVQIIREAHVIPVVLAPKCPEFEKILAVAKERDAGDASRLLESPDAAKELFNSDVEFDKLMGALGKSLSKSASDEVL